MRESILQTFPYKRSAITPEERFRDFFRDWTLKPWENEVITTKPGFIERIRGRGRRKSAINKFDLVLGDKSHLHRSAPDLVVFVIKHRLNENKRRILIWMHVVWIRGIGSKIRVRNHHCWDDSARKNCRTWRRWRREKISCFSLWFFYNMNF